jgi:hypothetical protein
VLIVLVALGAFQAWLYAEAPGKIEARVPAALAENGRANVKVELNFPPERYHIQALQNFGRVGGADGNTVQLRNVNEEGIASLARTYWVKSITLIDNP